LLGGAGAPLGREKTAREFLGELEGPVGDDGEDGVSVLQRGPAGGSHVQSLDADGPRGKARGILDDRRDRNRRQAAERLAV